MSMKQFKGLGVALITPFDANHDIDYEALEKMLKNQMNGGVDFLVIHGSTGEAATLSAQDKRDSLDFILEVVNGKLPIVLGIGSNNTKESVENISSFDFRGVDGLLVANPSYNKPSQKGIYTHFEHIANSTDLPIIVYNVPSRTASNISAETTLQLANNFENIVAIKEASGNLVQIIDIIKNKPAGFNLLSGDDLFFIGLAAYGAVGLISVIGNAYPKDVAELTHAAVDGNFKVARDIQLKLLNLTNLIFEEGNPSGVKEILSRMNLSEPFVRLPLTNISDELSLRIKSEMDIFERIVTN